MNKRGKEVDTTCCSLEWAAIRGWIHRDYIAHVLRWQHVVKRVHSPKFKDLWILDVGCGKEAPLPFTLYSNKLNHKGGRGGYLGVDYGKTIEPHRYLTNAVTNKTFNANFVEGWDFAKEGVPVVPQGARDAPCPPAYDVVVCFEVVEHIEPHHAWRLLTKIAAALKPGGYAYLSTPVYDPHVGAADNHVNEMSWRLMDALLGAAGLEWVQCYGTFASQKDIKPLLKQRGLLDLFDELSNYHESNVLANLFAPLFPQASRNCLWRCERVTGKRVYTANTFKVLSTPEHSSSARLAADLQRIMKEMKK